MRKSRSSQHLSKLNALSLAVLIAVALHSGSAFASPAPDVSGLGQGMGLLLAGTVSLGVTLATVNAHDKKSPSATTFAMVETLTGSLCIASGAAGLAHGLPNGVSLYPLLAGVFAFGHGIYVLGTSLPDTKPAPPPPQKGWDLSMSAGPTGGLVQVDGWF